MSVVCRRKILASLGAVAAFRATAAGAQSPSAPLPRIGVMMAIGETDPEGRNRLESLRVALSEAGWRDGRDIIIDPRWYQGNFQMAQEAAKDLIDRKTDVVVVNGTPGMDAMRAVGATMPLVFVVVSNPLGAGYVTNLSRPGGHITGFSTFEPEIAGKWLQLLRQIRPDLKHVGMLLDPKFKGFNSLWEAVEQIAPKHGIVARPAYASTLAEIEREVAALAAREASALIVAPSPVNTVNRMRLIAIANAGRLPTIYPFRFYVRDGALIAYGFNAADQFRRAGSYVDRILKGEKVGDLPVQAPSLFELGINLRTAKAMGLAIPQTLLIAADEIVE